MTKPSIARGVAATLLAVTALGARADVIDFNQFAHNDWFAYVGSPEQGGYRITNNCVRPNQCLGTWGASGQFQADQGGAALLNINGGTVTTLSRDDDAAFDLSSLDMADGHNQGAAQDWTFSFDFMDGSSRSENITLDALVGLQTLVFNLQGLKSVGWASASAGYYQVDNVQVQAATPTANVPEPASLASVLAALFAAGAALRWKGRRQA